MSTRRHDLDALRAFAMLLGIALHAALSFTDGPWLVRDAQRSGLFGVLITAVHGFRMPLFFLLSGFFTAMLWRRHGLRALLSHRFRRVFLPLMLGLVTVIPAMLLVIGWATQGAGKPKVQRERGQEPPNVWRASSEGDVEALKSLLAAGAEMDAQDPIFGVTPLTYAALYGRDGALTLLLEHGADAKAVNRDGGSALHAAAFLGRAQLVGDLLAAGANPSLRNQRGETALDSARADWRTTRFIARTLQIPVEEQTLRQGREAVQEMLGGGAVDSSRSGSRRFEGLFLFLTQMPVFHHLWFLWFLCWMVAGFALLAWPAGRLGFRMKSRTWITSPLRYLWLIPLTLVPAFFMGRAMPNFGPDTSSSLLPPLHLLAYYAIFFGFGALYHDSEDDSGRMGRRWWLTLPVALLVLYPAGMALIFGGPRWSVLLGGAEAARIGAVFIQVLYVWAMSAGMMGLFRRLITREQGWIRYLSDASYWMYVAHLPLVIALQFWVRDWPLAASWKFLLVCSLTGALLLLSYEYAVRYTWVGALLNGRKTRPFSAASASQAA